MSSPNNHFNHPIEEFCPSAISFNESNAEVIDAIYEECVAEKLFVELVWKPEALSSPHLNTYERRWAALLNRFLESACSGVGTHWFTPLRNAYEWRSYDVKLIEGIRKPNIILVPKGHVTPTFGSILTYCEIKRTPDALNFPGASVQMLQLAGCITNSQINRSFFLGANLCGNMLFLVLHARGNSFYSQSINIDESPRLFIKVILALSSGISTVLGFDPAFIPCYVQCCPAYRIDVKGQPGTKPRYTLEVTNQMYYRSYDMAGKGTKVAACKDAEETEERYYVLKETFLLSPGPNDVDNAKYLLQSPRDLSADEERIFGMTDKFKVFHGNVETFGTRRWDGKIYLRGIPVLVAAMVVSIPYYQDITEDSTRAIASRFISRLPPSVEQRVHYRTVSETCGIPIIWFCCRRELVNCVMAAGIGHFNGLLKDLLHCDPSEANTWLCVNNPLNPEDAVPDWPKNDKGEPDADNYPKRSGVLGDWGMAELQRPGVTRYAPAGITGTYPFLAAELLSVDAMNGKVHHESWHDLEALFWVLWIISVNSTGPYYQRREWTPPSPPAPAPTTVPSPDGIDPPHRLSTYAMNSITSILRTPADAVGLDKGVPQWATPGLHENEVEAVFNFKKRIPEMTFLGCMSPYWDSDDDAGRAFKKGMLELRERFVWKDNHPPSKTITHTEFITILKEMRDGIPAKLDCHGASKEAIEAGRARYSQLLESGQDLGVQLLDPPSPSLPKGHKTTSTFSRPRVKTSSAKRPSEHSAAEHGPVKRHRSDVGESQGCTQDGSAEPAWSAPKCPQSSPKKVGTDARSPSKIKSNPHTRASRGLTKK